MFWLSMRLGVGGKIHILYVSFDKGLHLHFVTHLKFLLFSRMYNFIVQHVVSIDIYFFKKIRSLAILNGLNGNIKLCRHFPWDYIRKSLWLRHPILFFYSRKRISLIYVHKKNRQIVTVVSRRRCLELYLSRTRIFTFANNTA